MKLAVIGARLNSSRLPRKHLLDLAGAPMISHIFARLETVPELDGIVLATTDDDYNRPLVAWARQHGKQVLAWSGDVNDLMGRVNAVVEQQNPSLVVYICGDSPLIEPGFISRVIAVHQQRPEIDLVVIDQLALPVIHEGIQIYSRSGWDKIMAASALPHEREHVGSAAKKMKLITGRMTDQTIFYKINHRLSVDTPSDYHFMSRIYADWFANHEQEEPVSLSWVIERLCAEPELATNSQVRQRTLDDRPRKILLITAADERIGLGHLSRVLAVAEACRDVLSAGVRLLVKGPERQSPELDLIDHRFSNDLVASLAAEGEWDAIVVDVPCELMGEDLVEALDHFAAEDIALVSIDHSLPRAQLQWVPSFFLSPILRIRPEYSFGWSHFLLRRPQPLTPEDPRCDLLVLTGGSDPMSLGETWPHLLDESLPEDKRVTWVRGPFAPPPVLPGEPRLNWTVVHDPPDLERHMAGATQALCTYGVSFFECLNHGLPTVTLGCPEGPESELLDSDRVTRRTANPQMAVVQTVALMGNEAARTALSQQAGRLLDGQGPRRLAQAIERELDGADLGPVGDDLL